MEKIKRVAGQGALTSEAKVAVVCSRFNHFVVDKLEEGCLDALRRHSGGKIEPTVFKVPGAFELPLVVSKVAKSGSFAAVIALGTIIRGDTAHFELVANSCPQGLAKISIESEIPVIFGVLTVDTIEQAIERSGSKAGNKGYEAALTAIEMISLLEQV